MTHPNLRRVWRIEQQPQRQDSLDDQLDDLSWVAARLGMYDASDWLWQARKPR